MSTQTSRHAPNSPASPHATSRKDASASSKNASKPVVDKTSGNELRVLNLVTEMGRQQLAVAHESSSALYRGSEALRRVQQEIAHEASVRHTEAAQKLAGPCQPADLLAVQTELVRANVQSLTHYWQELSMVALQMHREMMLSTTHMLENESGGGIKSALEAFQATIPPMPTSFFIPGLNEVNEQLHHH